MQSLAYLLGREGPLARHVAGFAPRPQQQAMAEAVAQALEERRRLITEAGTGTGKTYAYLVPALLSGKKVIVSTGTRNLQDQLFHRDLPVVRAALGVPVGVALLKGRANYVCRYRLEASLAEGRFRSRAQADELQRIHAWAGHTTRGDIAELGDVPEDSPIWPQATSTADNCLGQECPRFSQCHVMKARRAALEADVVIINHHLLFADMVLREDGFGELLPGADAFILDEAHQLPEAAANFFGLSLGSRQLLELARDTVLEQRREAGDMAALQEAAQRLEHAVQECRLALGREARRAAWKEVTGDEAVVRAMSALDQALTELQAGLAPAAPRGKGLDNCWQRSRALLERLQVLMEPGADDAIHWFETYTQAFTLSLTPLDVAGTFRSHLDAQPRAWIFTSATLAVGDSFEHFAAQLGLQDARTQRLDSPFDYARNALLYVPSAMPDPNEASYTEAVMEAALPVLEASRGRAFLLFTSHRALKQAAQRLQGRLTYPLLVQGEAPRNELLERFRAHGNAVLLGTSSFWEGVDVRGEALSCVVIDKLPFAAPGDPLLQARSEALARRGGNPFMDYQLPNAVIALKQGAGRLIRDVDDRGVLVLCDPRLLSKTYGRVFLDSLPPMPLTRRLEDVRAFFSRPDAGVSLTEHGSRGRV
ncbi:MAG: ATP-dependent DNA helicase [Gammaproteobacteria bacterium]|nr:ATP-dependent DNA helicase [Gammaproteobacteria bacterium]